MFHEKEQDTKRMNDVRVEARDLLPRCLHQYIYTGF